MSQIYPAVYMFYPIELSKKHQNQAYQREYYRTHKEARKIANKKYDDSAKGQATRKKYKESCKRSNTDQYREYHRKYQKEHYIPHPRLSRTKIHLGNIHHPDVNPPSPYYRAVGKKGGEILFQEK